MAKKAKKKTTKKTARKTAKKATKKAAKKATKKATKSSRTSAFPTMEMDDRRDDLYAPSAGSYNAGPSAAMGMDPEEGSSRRVAILGILVLLVVIVVAVVGREHWAGSKKAGDTAMVDGAKKGSKMEASAKKAPDAKAPKAEMPAAGGLRKYTVKKGDSLSGIARRMLGNPARWPEILKLNKLSSPTAAKVGKELLIPAK